MDLPVLYPEKYRQARNLERKKTKKMNKKNNNKGFTLAELLIVVAIIGVLIAIAMPTFGSQLEKARIATDVANLRAAYGEAVANYLTKNPSDYKAESDITVTFTHKQNTSWLNGYSDLPFDASGLNDVKANDTGKIEFDFSSAKPTATLK